MIRFGAAEVADHYAADFADWEQPYEAAVPRGGSAIDGLDQSHATCTKPMRRTLIIEGNDNGAAVIRDFQHRIDKKKQTPYLYGRPYKYGLS